MRYFSEDLWSTYKMLWLDSLYLQILFLLWRCFLKDNQGVLQLFHPKFTSFVRVHGLFLMTIIKTIQSAMLPMYHVWFTSCFCSCVWLHMCASLLSAFRVHTSVSLRGCPAGDYTANGKVLLFFITDTVSTCLREPQQDQSRVQGETDFLIFSLWVTRRISLIFEEMARDPEVHPLRGQKSFLVCDSLLNAETRK